MPNGLSDCTLTPEQALQLSRTQVGRRVLRDFFRQCGDQALRKPLGVTGQIQRILPRSIPRTEPQGAPRRLPERIRMDTDPCDLSSRWLISPTLSSRFIQTAARLPFDMSIISGYRTVQRQMELMREGRPAANPLRSTHTSCPATGADVRLGVAVTPLIQARFGLAAVESGLRWGGGSPVDPETGIPSDWNHVDLGPRALR